MGGPILYSRYYSVYLLLVCLLQYVSGEANPVQCFSDEDVVNARNAKRAFALLSDKRYPKQSILLLEEHPILSSSGSALPSVARKVSDALAHALSDSSWAIIPIDLSSHWTPDGLRLHLFTEVDKVQQRIKQEKHADNRDPLVVVQLHNLDGVDDMSILNVFHDAFGTPARVQTHGKVSVSFETVRFVGVMNVKNCAKNSRKVLNQEADDRVRATIQDASVRDRLGFDSIVWKHFARGAGVRKWEAVLQQECFVHDRVDFSPKALLRRVGDAILFDPATEGNKNAGYIYKLGSTPCSLGAYTDRNTDTSGNTPSAGKGSIMEPSTLDYHSVFGVGLVVVLCLVYGIVMLFYRAEPETCDLDCTSDECNVDDMPENSDGEEDGSDGNDSSDK
ncbi:hypothetical protein SARC_11170 [Sphaeroforma arctica JP610]|uniref:Uncharacterized protein n=1 Tax=Sphaeroforma arctica JP610 TaxID=667725 RepID=A0A0L0FHR2_9EUKA|nr:hypothetical protein SARC_11170 [Sphaeroforma arctica JP610]KNC76322.1 hypothetical protein SARC_11170 [Sphaeroforma arctica JP610]|eukprot:XP_014150224.1 hypothetical protein SARC_11170 [Sphaeroforma arctica JP610]